jgi:protease secretion system membrane fusion protein
MSNIFLKKTEAAEVISHDVSPLTVNTDPGAYTKAGWWMVLAGVGGFVLWATFAPLDKGVPMSGTVTSELNRQAVQHQAGGTVQEILVRNGAVVKAGQTLVRMNSVLATSQANITQAQYLSGRASEARLIAERDGASSIAFPPELTKKKDEARVAEIMRLQEQLFNSRRASLSNELSAVDENIAGLKLQLSATKESLESKKVQLGFLKEQLAGMRDLAKDGYVARNRLLDLERTYAQINGAVSEDIGMTGRLQRQVLELSLRRNQRGQDYQKDVRTMLSDVQKENEALASRMVAQDYEVAGVDVKAPVDGTVVGLAVFTEGGVVAPAFRLMDIVPSSDQLVVDGQLPTNLVDKVYTGLPVELMFAAFNASTTPNIPGEVIQVAADSVVDERTGFAYYVVRVKVTPEGAQLIAKNKMDIQSGMPVSLFVKTGERTMMNYLFKPLMDRAHSSLSEE